MVSEEFCGEDAMLEKMKRLMCCAISGSILTDEVTMLNTQKELGSNRKT
jgi:hypothetical protein